MLRFFRRKDKPTDDQGLLGYLFVPEAAEGVLRKASKGAVLKFRNELPSWVTIWREIKDVHIEKWPGVLWKVQALDEETAVVAEMGIRTQKIRILEKVPLSHLFGDYGEGVVKVVNAAFSLNPETVRKLSENFTQAAESLYSKGWNIFENTFKDEPLYYGYDNTGAVMLRTEQGVSPIHHGFDIIYRSVFRRAEELTEGQAVGVNENLDPYLKEEWGRAAFALMHAAMALAYQDKFTKEEIKVLSQAWEATYGELPLTA